MRLSNKENDFRNDLIHAIKDAAVKAVAGDRETCHYYLQIPFSLVSRDFPHTKREFPFVELNADFVKAQVAHLLGIDVAICYSNALFKPLNSEVAPNVWYTSAPNRLAIP